MVKITTLSDDDIEIGGGLGPLRGRVWRIGLMGESCQQAHVLKYCRMHWRALTRKGWLTHPGRAVQAAVETYTDSQRSARSGRVEAGYGSWQPGLRGSSPPSPTGSSPSRWQNRIRRIWRPERVTGFIHAVIEDRANYAEVVVDKLHDQGVVEALEHWKEKASHCRPILAESGRLVAQKDLNSASGC